MVTTLAHSYYLLRFCQVPDKLNLPIYVKRLRWLECSLPAILCNVGAACIHGIDTSRRQDSVRYRKGFAEVEDISIVLRIYTVDDNLSNSYND
jgi:hypothetical protein